jgi:LAO/AO transport system kinase
MHPLAQQIQQGNERSLARAITYIENDHPDKLELLQDIHSMTGKAHYIGLTGSPGAGKSSLVNQVVTHIRSLGLTVGIAAVDPTSPFSGGALLGDRVRMSQHFTDPGVYIRSMGTRGSLGGLARSTKEAVRLMDAFGFDVILIETVGVGQSELDIMKIADTTAVVLTPGSGDAVQIFKAGIMEIADLFIINKADLPGVPKIETELEALLDLVAHDKEWRPPIIQTITTENKGIEQWWSCLKTHREHLRVSGEGERRRREHLEQEVYEVMHDQLMKEVLKTEVSQKEEWLPQLEKGVLDPYSLAQKRLENWLKARKEG